MKPRVTIHSLQPIQASIACLFLLLFLAPDRALGQASSFGKNKVQYTQLDWRVRKSEHFHLYFYEGEDELSELAVREAERSYATLRGLFVHEVRGPIPLIIYSSHQDFEQSNVTPYFLPEGVAGLTEYARGRVLIPYGGSWPEFRTTLQHELVHVFQRSILAETQARHFHPGGIEPPLWFTEGLAVHWSERRDREADMVLRDLVQSGSLPRLEDFWRYDGTFTLYKLGQSMLDWIGSTYGEDRIHRFYTELWKYRTFDEAIPDVLGIPAKEASERWAFSLKERYFPEVAGARPAAFDSKGLTSKGGVDWKPLPLPDSLGGIPRGFVFLSPRNGFTNLYLASREGEEEDVTTLVAGEREAQFESFHEYRSRIDVSAEGILVFVSQHRDQDEIVLFSIPERREVERHRFPGVVGLLSPSFDPEGRRIVVSGLSRDGASDLYLYDRDTGRITRLTQDRYQDLDPAFCPWEESIAWASDRAPGGDGGEVLNLYRMDLRSGRVEALTRGPWKDSGPAWDPERRGLIYTSDRDGRRNVYWMDERGRGRRVTESLDAIFDPRIVPGERNFLASVFHAGRFTIRSFALPESLDGETSVSADSAVAWGWPRVEPGEAVVPDEGYRPHFALDVAQGGVIVDPALRSGEGVQAALSDMMGNHLIFMQFGNTNTVDSDFLRNLSAGFTYVNLTRRVNYGVSAFHLSGQFYDALDLPFREVKSGGGALLVYPFSKYQRIETHLNLAYMETDRIATDFHRKGAVATQSVSLVRDNTLWLATGPIDGERWNLTAGVTVNLRRGQAETTLLAADWRRYFRMGLYSAYAVRIQGRWSDGDNPDLFFLGGSHSMRAYPRRFLVGSRSALVNQEIRFPLLRGVALGLPMGTLELPGVEGALFADAGSAWDKEIEPEWRGAYGVGLRMGFGGFLVLRMDFGRRTDFESWDRTTHGEFFVGWDY